eukprot:jgi/Chlat1/526/Chrsp103S08596
MLRQLPGEIKKKEPEQHRQEINSRNRKMMLAASSTASETAGGNNTVGNVGNVGGGGGGGGGGGSDTKLLVWQYFIRTAEKRNTHHYGAICRACHALGDAPTPTQGHCLGTSDEMHRHLANCPHQQPDVNQMGREHQAKKRTRASTSAGNTTSTSNAHAHANKHNSNPNNANNNGVMIGGIAANGGGGGGEININEHPPPRAVKRAAAAVAYSAKDVPLNQLEQRRLEKLLIKATIAAHLPFHWVDVPEVKELFEFLRPAVTLPSSKALAERILDRLDEKGVG